MATSGANPTDNIFDGLEDIFPISEQALFFKKPKKAELNNQLDKAKAEIASLKLQLNAAHLLCVAKQEIFEEMIQAQVTLQNEVEELKEKLACQNTLQENKAVQSEILIKALTKNPEENAKPVHFGESTPHEQYRLRKRKGGQ